MSSQDEADALIRRRKAEPAKKTITAKVVQPDAPLAQSGQGRSQTYSRRDMVAETPKTDGQTGPDTPSQS